MAPRANHSHRFVTISFSHYVERARWALDRFGVAYEEEPHLPFFHFPAVYRVHRGRGGQRDAASSPFSTPLLIAPSGEIIADSRKILDYVDTHYAPPGKRLYANREIEPLEQAWHDRLAPHGRRLAYGALFKRPETLTRLATESVGGLEARVFSHALPLARRGIHRIFDLDESAQDRSRDVCRREFDIAHERLKETGAYLGGDVFSGIDLSFACFAAPCLLPAEYGVKLPALDMLAEDTRAFITEMRTHPAGAHALRMFSQHRRECIA